MAHHRPGARNGPILAATRQSNNARKKRNANATNNVPSAAEVTRSAIAGLSQFMAICCIQVPIKEIPCPPKRDGNFYGSMPGRSSLSDPASRKRCKYATEAKEGEYLKCNPRALQKQHVVLRRYLGFPM
jgi:hypothetical protein